MDSREAKHPSKPGGNFASPRPVSPPLDVCTRVTILALEPDPARAPAIRDVVSSPRVDVTVCTSKRQLLEALRTSVPDVILLPPLLSPADEMELVAHLRSRADTAHVEVLVTPFAMSPGDQRREDSSAARRWWRRHSSPPTANSACGSKTLAEQVTCALQRARQSREEGARGMRLWSENRSAAGDRILSDPYALRAWEPPWLELPRVSRHERTRSKPQPIWESYTHLAREDRRAHRRIPGTELAGLRAARLQHGPPVTLVDFSAGGVLLASAITLRPASVVALELCGEASDAVVPIRVIRCQSASTPSLYLGACAFKQPLDLSALLRVHPSGPRRSRETIDGFDSHVKEIFEQYVNHANGARGRGASHARRVADALRQLRDARRFDPGADAFSDLLSFTIAVLEEREEVATALTFIEHRLDEALPGLTARFGAIPALSLGADNESLYFEVPRSQGSAPQFLNVEMQQGTALEGWYFRLLKASAYLAALMLVAGRRFPVSRVS